MERDSRDLRPIYKSWPPGFLSGSMILDAGASARRRDGLTLVCLAVCAYCVGFSVTDWACGSHDKAVAAEVVALYRSRIVAEPLPAAAAIAPEPAPVVARRDPSPTVQKRTKPRALPASVPGKPGVSDEPTPHVSDDELNRLLAMADASTRIFASVDEVAPKPVVVRPPPAAVAAPRAAATEVRATAVEIEGLIVEGALPSKVVSRGIQRLVPQYDRCRADNHSAPQQLKLSTTIDEAGRGRRAAVEGSAQPDLRRCLEQATAHLVVPAPDTGTARAHWTGRFAAR